MQYFFWIIIIYLSCIVTYVLGLICWGNFARADYGFWERKCCGFRNLLNYSCSAVANYGFWKRKYCGFRNLLNYSCYNISKYGTWKRNFCGFRNCSCSLRVGQHFCSITRNFALEINNSSSNYLSDWTFIVWHVIELYI